MAKICPNIADVGDFWTRFAFFRCLIGPLVAKLLHILVEQVISFKMSGQTSNRISINFRNKQRVIDLDVTC